MKIIGIKRELAKYARELANEGLIRAFSGNISAKAGEYIYIKKSGAGFKNAGVKDFVDINDGKQASIEWKLHKACYRVRPDIKAVVHTHPLTILTLSSVGIKIKPVTIDFAIYLKNGIKQTKFASPGSKKLAQTTAEAVKSHDGVILTNHGLVTVGANLKEAVIRAIIAEREAKIILAAKLLHRNINALTVRQIKTIYNF